MLIIPFGIVGAVFGHYILGLKLTILSFIGLLGLSGILVNDSIILVSRLDERIDEGDELKEAAIGASRDRLRAVLLTSLTTIGGLIPLMFEKSLQAQFPVADGNDHGVWSGHQPPCWFCFWCRRWWASVRTFAVC